MKQTHHFATASFAQQNEAWVRMLCEHRDLLQRGGALEAVDGLLANQAAYKTPVLPIPLTLDRETFAALADAARHVMAAQTKILRYLYERHTHTRLLRMFDVPVAFEGLIDWEELLAGSRTIARFDVIPSESGFHFCELNQDSSVGGLEIADCLRAYCDALDWPLSDGLAIPQTAIAALLGRTLSARRLRRVVVCDWSSNRGNGYFGFDLLRSHLSRALPDVDVQLVYEDEYPRAWLAPDVGSETLVYRGFMLGDMTDGGAFVGRLRASGATIVNTFETELRLHKRWFALLWENEHRSCLSSEEVAAIEAFVPFTVSVDEGNLGSLLERKAELVFKLGRSSGGEGVLIGAHHCAQSIVERLQATGVSCWTAQRLVEGQRLALPSSRSWELTHQHVVLGLFMTDGCPSGVTVAASPSSQVVNIHNDDAAYTWAAPLTVSERSQLSELLAARDHSQPVPHRRAQASKEHP